QANVDDRHVILDARDGALHHLAFEGFILAAEAFVEERREIVAGRESGGRHKVCRLSNSLGPAAWSPPWRTFTYGPGQMHCRQSTMRWRRHANGNSPAAPRQNGASECRSIHRNSTRSR